MSETETRAGNCHYCGTWAANAILITYIEQGNGPGYPVVECPPCRRKPRRAAATERPRTHHGW